MIADFNEIEKSADVVIFQLLSPELKEQSEILFAVPKQRSGGVQTKWMRHFCDPGSNTIGPLDE